MLNLISIAILLISLTIHEFSHAFVADRLGDPTPRANGRLTLNPLAHLDPLGTIMLIFAHFGWGKPVPIDPYNFSQPRRDEILVSFAGPGSNFLLAIIFALIIRFTGNSNAIFLSFVYLNVFLGVFNLLPIPPLDGSKILLNLLPEQTSLEWEEALSRYGFLILAVLLFFPIGGSNLINLVISPIGNFFISLLLPY